jgi:two-component sensor histidine kinase/HAMP domain-containing protein
MRLSIRAQIIVACLAVILPLAAIEIYYLLDRYPSARRHSTAHALQNAQAIASAAAAFTVTLQDGALVLAQEARLAAGDPRRIQPILERMARATKTQAYVAFILPGGRVAAAFPREIVASGLNVADRPFFQALRAGGEWRPVNLTQSPVRGIPVWGVATAVRSGERFLGAVALTVPATEFSRLIPVKMPAGSWSIVDARGRLVYLNEVAEIPWEKRDRSGGELVRRALAGEEATSEEFAGPDGVPRLGASMAIRPFGWVVEVSEPASQVLAQARTEAWIHGSKYGPALAIALLIALFIANRISAPLQRLTAAAERIARGEYGATAQPAGPPELLRLMSSFNSMSTNIARRHRWDEALTAIGRVAASRMPLGEILAAGLEAMIGASGASLGLIRLVDAKTRDLVIAAHRDLPPSYLEVARAIPWGAKLAGSVAATGEAWLVGHLQEQPEVSHLSLLADRVQSLACLPLKTHDRALGTITLGHSQPEFFGPADLPVLLQAASLLAGDIVAEQLHAATSKEAEEKSLLFRELDHRVRNNLAALISLLHLAAEGTEGDAAESLQEMAERVARLADVHNLLAGRGMQPVEVRELAEVVTKNVLAALPGGVRIHWKVLGVPIRIPPSQVTAVALVLNELLTNSAKHAFPGRATGSVTILVTRDADQAVLEVRDDGVGLDMARVPAGLGLTIVRTLATQNLKGSVMFAMAGEGGTVVRIRFPQPEDTPAGGAP